jgi:RNA polymerase sigma-70 factor (ECF subfamily)
MKAVLDDLLARIQSVAPAIPPHPPSVNASRVTDSPRPDSLDRWFAEEVHPHDSQLRAFVRGSFPDVRDVDDVVQESYLRIWKRHGRHPVASVKAFLFKIARHLALNKVRHQRVSPFVVVTDFTVSSVIDSKPDTAERVCSHEEIQILFAAIDALPGRCREVYILRKLKGLSQKEIARTMGISEQTVEVQIVRANRRCAAFLQARGVLRR